MEAAAPSLIADREIQVWSARLDRDPHDVARLRRLLSRDECDRADRFRFRRDHDRYVVGRATLRLLLGRYVGSAPQSIRFRYSEHRKPSLLEPASGVSFNLSHSEGLAVYAF